MTSGKVGARAYAEFARFDLESLEDKDRIPEPVRRVFKALPKLKPIFPSSSIQSRIDHDPLVGADRTKLLQRQFKRAVRATVKDYALELTGLSRWIDRWRDVPTDSHTSTSSSGRQSRAYSFQIGVSHLRPNLSIGARVGPGRVRCRVEMPGVVDVEYSPRAGRMHDVNITYDRRDDSYKMGLRYSF